MVVAQASTYGSILPAAWSFMLAARARGLGTVWTTIHLFFEKEVGEATGDPGRLDAGGAVPRCLLHGRRFQAGPSFASRVDDPLGQLGRPSMTDEPLVS